MTTQCPCDRTYLSRVFAPGSASHSVSLFLIPVFKLSSVTHDHLPAKQDRVLRQMRFCSFAWFQGGLDLGALQHRRKPAHAHHGGSKGDLWVDVSGLTNVTTKQFQNLSARSFFFAFDMCCLEVNSFLFDASKWTCFAKGLQNFAAFIMPFCLVLLPNTANGQQQLRHLRSSHGSHAMA